MKNGKKVDPKKARAAGIRAIQQVIRNLKREYGNKVRVLDPPQIIE